MQFILWLMNLLGITPQDLLLTGIILLAGAILGVLALLFAYADRHSK